MSQALQHGRRKAKGSELQAQRNMMMQTSNTKCKTADHAMTSKINQLQAHLLPASDTA
jgi:hypothetical protein